jgi:hypothetical protein
MHCNIQNFTVSMLLPSKITGKWLCPYGTFGIQVDEYKLSHVEVCLVLLATTPNVA